ncbi:DUF4083 domain-containing protein [Halobacillus litoralis]|uniref:DUF4083 family protein n=1 Tax=Halobacillus litoralis TaxID=45668 RepID=UPI001CD49F53|nr:DUF4083 family protein [Halobacillus litoralis]MCA0970460.1 DUF4083 domain-containing protein [Halobacillus litoralis]
MILGAFYLGDMIFQIMMFLFIVGIFYVVYRLIADRPTRRNADDTNEKLDRIIQLLEDERK